LPELARAVQRREVVGAQRAYFPSGAVVCPRLERAFASQLQIVRDSRQDVRGGTRVHRAPRRSVSLDAGVVTQAIDQIVQLLLGQLDLLIGPILVDPTLTHRDADLIQVPNLGEDLIGQTPKLQEAPTFGERSSMTHPELLRAKTARLVEH